MAKYFGTDGIRGIASLDLTESFARRAGYAIGNSLKAAYRGRKLPYFKETDCSLPHPSVLLGRDTRISSPQLAESVSDGLRAAGVSVADMGIVSTPLVGLLMNRFNAIGGVMVTASHNPVEYNGIKVFRSDGLKVGSSIADTIERELDSREPIPTVRMGSVNRLNAIPLYIKHLRQNNRVRGDGIRIALDMAHGAACGVAEEAFSGFGFDVVPVCATPDGNRINVNCGATDIARLQAKVLRSKAQWGFAFDGDADRVVAVDGNGVTVNGDLLMALLALEHKPYRKAGKLVFTHMTNRGVELHLRGNGIKTYRTDVGDMAVLKAMRRWDTLIGGEQSGHIICWDKTCGGDGVLVALFVSGLLARKGLSLVDFVSSVPVYAQVLKNVMMQQHRKWECDVSLQRRLRALQERYCQVRIYIRSSGTENLVRILTEAEDGALALEANEEATQLFSSIGAKPPGVKEE